MRPFETVRIFLVTKEYEASYVIQGPQRLELKIPILGAFFFDL